MRAGRCRRQRSTDNSIGGSATVGSRGSQPYGLPMGICKSQLAVLFLSCRSLLSRSPLSLSLFSLALTPGCP